MYQNLLFFMKNRKKWLFSGQKLSSFGLRQAVEDPPPSIWRVLDTKEQVVEAYMSRKHNLQHVYAPKFAIFHEKTAKNGFFLAKN